MFEDDKPFVLYQGRKINFIKAVREATGASLHWAKWAVDLCVAAEARLGIGIEDVGSHQDFIKAVRFLTSLQQDRDVDFTCTPVSYSDEWDSVVKAIKAVEYGRLESEVTLQDYIINYWD